LADFIVTLHSYNVYLVILAGLVTAIWGFVLYAKTRSVATVSAASVGATGEQETTQSSKTSSPAQNEEVKERARSWRVALTVTIVLALIQGVLGVTMVLLGLRPGRPDDSLYYLHFVYGGIVALVIPVATTYATGGKNRRRDILIYSIAALILTAAAVRAWMTGPAVFTLLP
jgi:heme A synthase